MPRWLTVALIFWPVGALAEISCADVDAIDQGDGTVHFASKDGHNMTARALVHRVTEDRLRIWLDDEKSRINLDAPLVIWDESGRECETPLLGGYAHAIDVRTNSGRISKIAIPVCNLSDGICDYVQVRTGSGEYRSN